MEKLRLLKRVGGVVAKFLRRRQRRSSKVVELFPHQPRTVSQNIDSTPVYSDTWSIQNEVHP
jgi:hypothetical protein